MSSRWPGALFGARTSASSRHSRKELTASVELGDLQAEVEAAGAASAANELRAAILSAVSHDLRTPISAIKASVTSLLQEDIEWSPEARHEFLNTIDEETDRLNGLVGNLLDMSRIQSGALEMTSAPVGLEEVLPAAVHSLGLEDEAVDLDVPDTLPRVIADRGLLERALANLIQNAVRFSPAGRRVRVTAGAIDGVVDVRVVDRGPGVPLDQRERIFLPFQRLGDSGNDEGVGLGLAVAKGFVEAMGGEIEVEDTPGGGLTVVTRLRTADDPHPRRRRRAADPPRARDKSEGAGVRRRPGADGEAALILAARHHPDVVVLDLGLPGIDGIEVIRGLRGWSAVPIVVLSVRRRSATRSLRSTPGPTTS